MRFVSTAFVWCLRLIVGATLFAFFAASNAMSLTSLDVWCLLQPNLSLDPTAAANAFIKGAHAVRVFKVASCASPANGAAAVTACNNLAPVGKWSLFASRDTTAPITALKECAGTAEGYYYTWVNLIMNSVGYGTWQKGDYNGMLQAITTYGTPVVGTYAVRDNSKRSTLSATGEDTPYFEEVGGAWTPQYTGYIRALCYRDEVPCTAADCSPGNTARTLGVVGTDITGCTCTCRAGYGPAPQSCAKEYCTLAYCGGPTKATSANLAGFVEDSQCNCNCREQYLGLRCATRICHTDHDCRGQGLTVTGTFPNCICACNRYFGGRNCRTLTATRALTASATASLTLSTLQTASNMSPSRSKTDSFTERTRSRTLTAPRSATFSSLTTPSASTSSSATPSLSSTLELSKVTLSSTPSSSFSISATRSGTGTRSEASTCSNSPSLSMTLSATQPTESPLRSTSVSASRTCRDYLELNVNDTCAVLRPLPPHIARSMMSSNVNVNSSTGGGDGESPFVVESRMIDPNAYSAGDSTDATSLLPCTTISIPYTDWGGRRGSQHAFVIASIDARIPLSSGALSPPKINGAFQESNGGGGLVEFLGASMRLVPLVVQFASREQMKNVTLGGGSMLPFVTLLDASDAVVGAEKRSLNATGTFFTAFSRLSYNGPPTLNTVRYSISGLDKWSRCPIAMPSAFTIVLQSSERLLDPIVAEVASVGGTIASVAGALTVSPTVILQLSIVSSLQVMSRCRPMLLDGDEEGDDDNYNDYKEGVQNPLSLALGATGGGRRFLRGAIATSAFYVVALSAIMTLYSLAGAWCARFFSTGGAEEEEESFLQGIVLQGYPSALVAAAAFAIDGALGAGTILVVYSSGAGDVGLGAATVGVIALYLLHVALATTIQMPAALRVVEVAQSAAKGNTQTKDADVRREGAEEEGVFADLITSPIESDLDLLGLDVLTGGAAASLDDDPVARTCIEPRRAPNSAGGAQNADDPLNLDCLPLTTGHESDDDPLHLNSDDDPLNFNEHSIDDDDPLGLFQSSDPRRNLDENVRRGRIARWTEALTQWGCRSTHEWTIVLDEKYCGREVAPSDNKLTVIVAPSRRGDDDNTDEDHEHTHNLLDPQLLTISPLNEPGHREKQLLHNLLRDEKIKSAEMWLSRYDSYITDNKVSWYCALELSVAAAVTVLGSLAFENVPFCVARGVVCCVLVLGQLAVMVLRRPPVHRWRWVIGCAALGMQSAAAALSVANAVLQDVRVELGMDALGVGVMLIVFLSSAVDVIMLIRSLLKHARQLALEWPSLMERRSAASENARRGGKKARNVETETVGRQVSPPLDSSSPAPLPLVLLAEEMADVQINSDADDGNIEMTEMEVDTNSLISNNRNNSERMLDETSESHIVNQILIDFKKYQRENGH